jgi:hypothetical protein
LQTKNEDGQKILVLGALCTCTGSRVSGLTVKSNMSTQNCNNSFLLQILIYGSYFSQKEPNWKQTAL